MTIEGVDYAWAPHPDPAGLYAAGKRFACRYLSYDGSKDLSASERDALWGAGIAICLNWENRADDISDGYAGGARNATRALALANALAWPATRPIYFSIDQDTSGNPPVIDAYLHGIASVLPVARIGVYGGYATIAHAHDAGLASWFWQTYAWSGGRWHPAAHVQQYRNSVQLLGADTDLNRAMVDDYGQWNGADDMAFDDIDKARLNALYEGTFFGGTSMGEPTDPVNKGSAGNAAVDQYAELRRAAAEIKADVAEIKARPAAVMQVDAEALKAVVLDPDVLAALAAAVNDDAAARWAAK